MSKRRHPRKKPKQRPSPQKDTDKKNYSAERKVLPMPEIPPPPSNPDKANTPWYKTLDGWKTIDGCSVVAHFNSTPSLESDRTPLSPQSVQSTMPHCASRESLPASSMGRSGSGPRFLSLLARHKVRRLSWRALRDQRLTCSALDFISAAFRRSSFQKNRSVVALSSRILSHVLVEGQRSSPWCQTQLMASPWARI